MSMIKWDAIGERLYETGLDRGVLYNVDASGQYPKAVPWNGLTAVNEAPTGAEPNKQYADNMAYINMLSPEEYAATIEAFWSPKEFDVCDGNFEPVPGMIVGQQTRKPFGFSYRTLIGNDVDQQDHGYEIHVVYQAMAAPSERNHATLNDSPEATQLSWEITTTPLPIPGGKPAATLRFSTEILSPEQIKLVEDTLYGTDGVSPDAGTEGRLPLPEEWVTLLSAAG